MLKKTITYVSPFTEQKVTEEHYFHISKADLVEMEVEEHGQTYKAKDGTEYSGMQAKLQRIIEAQDGRAIMAEFKDIIRRAYGKKEGDRFIKSQAIWEEFAASEAFSELLYELCTNAAAAGEFTNKIVPGNLEQLAAEVRDQAAKVQTDTPVDRTEMTSDMDGGKLSDRAKERANATPENPVQLKQSDIMEMDVDDFKSGIITGRYVIDAPSGHTNQ